MFVPDREARAGEAAACAGKIVKAIRSDKKEILVGGKELLAVKLKRFFPLLFEVLIRKQSPF